MGNSATATKEPDKVLTSYDRVITDSNFNISTLCFYMQVDYKIDIVIKEMKEFYTNNCGDHSTDSKRIIIILDDIKYLRKDVFDKGIDQLVSTVKADKTINWDDTITFNYEESDDGPGIDCLWE